MPVCTFDACVPFRTPCSPSLKTAAAAPRLCNAVHPRTPPLRGCLVNIALDCTLRSRLHRRSSPATYDCTPLRSSPLATLNSTLPLHCSSTGTLRRRRAARGRSAAELQAGFCSGAARGGFCSGAARAGFCSRAARAPNRLQTL